MSSLDPRIRLIDVRDTPLSIDEVLAAVAHPQAGGVGVFVGTVRDHDGGQNVAGLSYSAHPSAELALDAACESVLTPDVLAVAATHRVGDLSVGDVAVITAVACAHRAEALAQNAKLIDEIKASVPIWKHQTFVDGTDEWVGIP